MKHLIFGTLALVSLSAFGQATPSQVCQEISRYSSSNGAICAGAISRAMFDQSTLDVAMAVARTGSSTAATRIMQSGGNRYLDDSVAAACREAARYSGDNAALCAESAFDHAFDPAVGQIALAIARTGSTSAAVRAVQNGRNGAAHPSAANVCVAIAPYSGDNAASCVTAILNKDYFNNSESVCLTLANQGSTSSAVQCLQNSGIQTHRRPGRRPGWGGQPAPGGHGRPMPAPMGVTISLEQYQELDVKIRQAQNAMMRRQYPQANLLLDDLVRTMDEIRAGSR